MVNHAAARAFWAMSWRTALTVTVIAGALGAGLLTAGAIIDAHLNIPERATVARVLDVTACYREECGYSLSYTDARGTPELAEIPGPQGEARDPATVRIYYQDAHPAAARFPDTAYQGSQTDLNTLIGIGVITILFALFMLLVTLVKVARFIAGHHRHGARPPARDARPWARQVRRQNHRYH